MSTERTNDGGPAFPVMTAGSRYYGLSLRDYFAAKAMQVAVVSRETGDCEVLACYAYLMADAMLKAREVKP